MNGSCYCGCGGRPPLSDKTCRRDGYVKGQPIRYMPGHATAIRNKDRAIPWRERVIENASGCLVWQGALQSKGYGCIGVRGAHVFVWEEQHGAIPTGLTIDHLCEEKRCLNTAHMEVVTRAENTRRRWARERARKAAA